MLIRDENFWLKFQYEGNYESTLLPPPDRILTLINLVGGRRYREVRREGREDRKGGTMRPLNVLACVTVIFVAIDTLCYHVSGDVFGESSVYTLTMGFEGYDLKEAKLIVFASTFFTIISLVTVFFLHKIPCVGRLKGYRLFAFYGTLVMCILSTGISRYLINLVLVASKDQGEFEQRYRIPPEGSTTLPEEPYNLVYLYLESLEASFFDDEVFPGLVPNLKRLSTEAHHYTDVHDVGDFTMGSFVASQCGIKLITPLGSENFMDSGRLLGGYLPDATCIGDHLRASGYNLEYMGGADTNFAGKNLFLQSHGFKSVKGNAELRRPGESRAPWGRFDDVLLDDLFSRYTELSAEDEPFSLFSLTADTHAPDGVVSSRCGDLKYGDGKNSMLNAVHCSDKLIAEFVDKIRTHSSFERTLLVVGNDHRMMGNVADPFLKEFSKKLTRKNFLFVFDGKVKELPRGGVVSTPGSTFDVGATVLSYLTGGRLTELGLGRSLREQDGLVTLMNEYQTLDSFNEKTQEWRTSFKKFWRFPDGDDQPIDGFSVDAAGVVHISGSKFRVPAYFKLDSESGLRILEILLHDQEHHLQTQLRGSNETALMIDTCTMFPPVVAGAQYCYLYRRDGNSVMKSIATGEHVPLLP